MVPVYLTNVSDSIVGFTLWVRSTWPELFRFGVSSVDTELVPRPGHPGEFDTNIAVYAKFDTVGTRSRGFKFFDARIQDAMHGQVKISAICDADSPRVVKPIPPGTGVLMNLIMETTEADSVCADMPVHKVRLQLDRSVTSFSNPAGQVIGCNYVIEVDTSYGCCKTWNSNYTTCLEYWPPEHMCIREVPRCVSIDTTRRVLVDGTHDFTCGPPCQCGNANGDAAINISDAVYLIAYIFAHGVAPGPCGGNPIGLGDANGDNAINISDAVYLISYIFAHGPTPHCP